MGFFDLFKKASYLGRPAGDLGDDFDDLVRRFTQTLIAPDPIIEDMGPMVICRSPVLVIVGKQLRQPAALLPRPMLSRFYAEPGNEAFDDPNLIPLVVGYARALAANDKLARAALRDTEDVYVDKEAPTTLWPTQDLRLRLASLVLADVVRKLAANLTANMIKSSYGLGDAPDAARMRIEEMKAEEGSWYMAAVAGSPELGPT